MAEREGFEPSVSCPTAVFKTAALNHSTISPQNVFTIQLFSEKSSYDCKNVRVFLQSEQRTQLSAQQNPCRDQRRCQEEHRPHAER